MSLEVINVLTFESWNLKTIINPSGKSFNWSSITGQCTSDTYTFATGTCGSITIKAS